MIYIRKDDAPEAGLIIGRAIDDFPNISVTGSVVGMRKIYGWPSGGQVRMGAYIYNIGPVFVKTLKEKGLIHG